jgi:hypothetical protein
MKSIEVLTLIVGAITLLPTVSFASTIAAQTLSLTTKLGILKPLLISQMMPLIRLHWLVLAVCSGRMAQLGHNNLNNCDRRTNCLELATRNPTFSKKVGFLSTFF